MNEHRQRTKDLLFTCESAQLDELVVRLDFPAGAIPDNPATPATRRKAIWELVQQDGQLGLAVLEEEILKLLGSPRPPPLFYVSYPRDGFDVSRRRFLDDLLRELRRQDPNLTGEVGYWEEDANEPSAWCPWSVRALQQRRVFVCLWSRAFFNSAYCGKEWAVFRSRQQLYQQRSPPSAPWPQQVLPVQWGPPEENPSILPVVAREITHRAANFDSLYAEIGLRALLEQVFAQRPDGVAAYQRFLEGFTRELLRLIDQPSLPVLLRAAPLPEVESVFPSSAGIASLTENKGQSYALFVFVVAPSRELQYLRQNCAAYGNQGQAWMPYHPQVSETVEYTTQEIATNLGMTKEVMLPNADLVVNLRQAEADGKIVLLIADPWTIWLNRYGQFMQAYDERSFLNCAVLIPWNEKDEETRRHWTPLRDNLGAVFQRKIQANEAERFRDAIRDARAFRQQLRKALTWVRDEIGKNTRSARPVLVMEMPRVQGGPPAVPPHRKSSVVVVRTAEGRDFVEQPFL